MYKSRKFGKRNGKKHFTKVGVKAVVKPEAKVAKKEEKEVKAEEK